MTDASGNIWLAVTAFDQPIRLADALVDFHARDIGPDVLCLLGRHGVVDGMRGVVCDGGVRTAFLPLFRDLVRVPFPIDGEPVFATAGRLLTNVTGGSPADRRQVGPTDGVGGQARPLSGCWLPDAQRDRLAGAITDGGVVLLANPRTRAHWTDSTKVLLRHSRHPVQSHELLRAHLPDN